MTRKKILAISGSTRKYSTNEAILKYIAREYADDLDITLYSEISTLPHFNPDHDNDDVPQSVKDLRTLIQQADGIIICTPEYVFSLPGALKNAIEWTVSTTVFSDKPAALIVASAAGEKTFESLVLIMTTVGTKIAADAKILIQGARSKVIEGEIANENTRVEIKKLMGAFERTINENLTAKAKKQTLP